MNNSRTGSTPLPVDNLMSNWAYMVMTALAWNLKAWFALMIRRERRDQLLRMEFRAFLQSDLDPLPDREGKTDHVSWATTGG